MAVVQEADSGVKTQIVVGGGVSLEADITDASKIYVDIGLGFNVECPYDDALRIAKMRQAAAQVHSLPHPPALLCFVL